MEAYIRLRHANRSKITRIQTAVNKHIDQTKPLSAQDVTLHLENLIELKAKVKDIQEKIEQLCTSEDEINQQAEAYEWYDDMLHDLQAALLSIQEDFPVPEKRRRSRSPQSAKPHTSVKLPLIELPTFTGNYEDWSSFEDLFSATIDKNPSLSGAQKLQYLKSSVKGDAASLIKQFQVTDINYVEAWKVLKERYSNEREIVQSILKRLLTQSHITKESASSLQKLLDTTNECIRALSVLNRPVNHWDDVLVFMVVERMDQESKRQWAMTLKGTTCPTFQELSKFIDPYVRGLNAGGVQPKATFKSNVGGGGDRQQTSSHHSATEDKCVVCSGPHPIFWCQKFKSLPSIEKTNTVKSKGLCINCLSSTHRTPDCKSQRKCKKCNKSHNTLLHVDKKPEEQTEQATVQAMFTEGVGETTQVLLSTALVTIKDHFGTDRVCRVLLDGGSQASFITENCVKSLGLKRHRSNVKITGISSAAAGYARGRVDLLISSRVHQSSIEVEALILPRVTGTLPKSPCHSSSEWKHILGLQLADPQFHHPGPIDILLGADVTASIMREGRRTGPRLTPIAQNSIFGWVLSGRVTTNTQQAIKVFHASCETETILRRFWELEELPPVKLLTKEEKFCEKHFTDTHTRDSTGRYTVQLPTHDVSTLGNSKDMAISRLKQVERRLSRAPAYQQQYVKFMHEYQSLNHMELVKSNSSLPLFEPYYLPHHFVLKEDSTTTKFRVVFDGSAKSTSGVSLNNCLYVGPTVQDDLYTLLLRFRCHVIALKADITKMYRQFKVKEDQQDLQRIVWRDSPDLPIQEFRLTTVTYGTASAPFLATRCLRQLAEDEKDKFGVAAPVLMNDMYVDDLMSGESTPERAIILQQQLSALVESGGMEIRKWSSNDTTVLQSIPQHQRETELPLKLDTDNSIKALGVQWNPASDKFIFDVQESQEKSKLTKRTLLSELAKVFDPLGWLAPTTICAKIMFQQLWRLNLNWDDVLPDDLQQQWERYQNQLHFIKLIEIPRCIITATVTSHQLHGFCDASEKAYAAAVYLRCEKSDGSIIVNLVTAKTKVAPIKQVSLPRLELCGAVMVANLLMTVKTSIKLNCPVYAWTDSTIVLRWLSSFPGRWKTFAANRVSEIQDLVPVENWNHVVSEQNPADCASRGILAAELTEFSLWWDGPQWLKHSTFPVSPHHHQTAYVDLEEKKVVDFVGHVCVDSTLISKYSSLKKLKRVTAYCIRFIQNCKQPNSRTVGELSCEELESALQSLIKQVQSSFFGPEIKNLNLKKEVKPTSKILQLHPFLDLRGILRVGGRLHKANLPESVKHPIILPHNHHLTDLIIQDCHLTTLHGGFQLIWTTLKQKFWILRARDTIRHHVRRCVVCRRQRAETAKQLMGSLPSARVNPGRAFCHTGVDYAGPFQIRPFKGRSKITFKCYFSIFVCLATTAVHLEAVSELTTEAFIAAFKRFVSRRGVCSHMYSDCGTNFIGADAELKALLESSQHNSTLTHHLADKGITWKFNPPGAPHQGGLWEAGVKSVKHHLRRVIGSTTITFEEFQTVLCQVEACLNSRPLCAISCDPEDLSVLTPGNFLIGCALTAVPEPDLTHIKLNRLSKWQLTQQMFQHFWRRWSAEYLSSLQQRFKWSSKRSNLAIGDLVIIKDENLPPMKWDLGRVIAVHPGADSCVRVVTVKTARGELKRPVVKLCPILYNDE